MVTSATYLKQHFFRSTDHLSLLHDALLNLALKYGWELQAWAVFSNHYHFVAVSPCEPQSLRPFIRHLHSITAIEMNRRDRTGGRKVWFQYWDTHLTYDKSYFARLNYVHSNAVHHGLVPVASAYPWSSARWFERKANGAFYKRIMGLPTDRLHVADDYVPHAVSAIP
ncbi:MAG TPA: transposase [Terriglobia bacterium]|nr:transposase [Terriglobia bacterium]